MFILFFCLWIILNGKITLEIVIFGLLFAAVLDWFAIKHLGNSIKYEKTYYKRIPDELRYALFLIIEIIKANLCVIRMICDIHFEPKPQLISFDSKLRTESCRLLFANSITLTPGTITYRCKNGEYVVHCLDELTAVGLSDGEMITRIRTMEEKQ